MARGSSKKSSKSAKTSSFAPTNTALDTSTSTASSPPSPFEPAHAALLPLAKSLPRDHVFVIHPEQTPPALRRQAFIVPVLLNLIISAGLCWRLYRAVPVYLEQLITILGYETSWTVTPKNLAWGDLINILGSRTILLAIDYVIFGILGRWPYEFLFGDSRPKEPVVRRGRKWDVPIFLDEEERKKQAKPSDTWTREEELAVYTKCTDALRKSQTSKNALSLLDKDWDLDYRAMVDSTELIDQTELSLDDVDHVVLVPWQGKWYSWYPHKVKATDGHIDPIPERDERLESFKKHLIQLGCEDVFYRWIEIVQYETSQPARFTQTKRNEAEQELRRMLRSRKKDDEAFVQAVGGLQNVPGLGP
ncbi:hypothetical protein LTR70_004515 [Exophiala xenobiotica]|uniref:Uncharacterized protein n=1 Tax=Lithohypha guttulata TaxID=1690604 RepID=A0ABR0KQT5_9EURO|nr:hypothetical protein LTR24_000445 [Lithohypha guttulata]KAK5320432.1 hypothetical protein LTR70_004515 [Exophiala xenobiotica]